MIRKRIGVGLLIVVVFSAAFLGVRQIVVGASVQTAIRNEPLLDAIAAAEAGHELAELLIIYVGSSRCGWCDAPELGPAFRTVVDSLRYHASELLELYPTVIGVDLDAPRGGAMRHLTRIGTFDQVSLGGGYLNAVAAEATWGDIAGPPGTPTPQVIVLRRKIRKLNRRGEPLALRVGRPDVLARKVGLKEIVAWVAAGVPLSTLAFEPR